MEREGKRGKENAAADTKRATSFPLPFAKMPETDRWKKKEREREKGERNEETRSLSFCVSRFFRRF